jgi:hypothetical protein
VPKSLRRRQWWASSKSSQPPSDRGYRLLYTYLCAV